MYCHKNNLIIISSRCVYKKKKNVTNQALLILCWRIKHVNTVCVNHSPYFSHLTKNPLTWKWNHKGKNANSFAGFRTHYCCILLKTKHEFNNFHFVLLVVKFTVDKIWEHFLPSPPLAFIFIFWWISFQIWTSSAERSSIMTQIWISSKWSPSATASSRPRPIVQISTSWPTVRRCLSGSQTGALAHTG